MCCLILLSFLFCTVPLVNCTGASISVDKMSVRIVWDNIHTGGLNLSSATVEYALLTSSNFTTAVNETVNVVGGGAVIETLPTAGLVYVFRVTTENAEGESIPSSCPPLFLAVGRSTLCTLAQISPELVLESFNYYVHVVGVVGVGFMYL